MITPKRLIAIHDDPYTATAEEIRWLVQNVGDPKVFVSSGRPTKSVVVELRARPDYRECRRCHVVKPLDEFQLRRTGAFGRGHLCRPCEYKDKAEYKRRHPENVRKNKRAQTERLRAQRLERAQ